mgnify:CR=1 FL=1|tara:strand:- start:271 stop:1086 length:816 start_codon:yes stop_codon:yes gene_type:complete
MARVIVITAGKGGVGKSTVTSNIGMALARLNKKVLLMDGDIGLRNLDLLLGIEERVVYTGSDVISLRCRIDQVIVPHKKDSRLHFFPVASSQNKISIYKEDLIKFVNAFYYNYDFILIDCPAGVDNGFYIAIAAAQEAIVIVNPEVTSLRDADKVIGLLQARGIIKIVLLINKLRSLRVYKRGMISKQNVKDVLGLPIIGIIPESEDVVMASNRGEPLVLNDVLSQSGLAFDNAAKRIIDETVGLIDLNLSKKESNFFFVRVFKRNILRQK